MFFRIPLKDNKTATDGRPVIEHWQEHINWCIKTFFRNGPDTPEVMKHMHDTCVTWIGRSKNSTKYFAGDAVYNAFIEISRRPKGAWEEVATEKQKKWLKNFDTKLNKKH